MFLDRDQDVFTGGEPIFPTKVVREKLAKEPDGWLVVYRKRQIFRDYFSNQKEGADRLLMVEGGVSGV